MKAKANDCADKKQPLINKNDEWLCKSDGFKI
jgi:hypothetical protein